MQMFQLIGFPLRYSLSPQIHSLFAQQFALSLNYQLAAVPPNRFSNFVQTFFNNSGKGLNVTAPYKERIICQLDGLDPLAQATGAVNTIYQTDAGAIFGTNTDGIGLMRDFARRGIDVNGQRILLIGAGGAARGILGPMLDAKPAEIIVVNRTQEKAKKLIADFDVTNLQYKTLNDLSAINADVIIHAISSNLLPELYAQINYKNAICYDLNYQQTTNFMHTAAKKDAKKIFNGLGMLVEQAAEAFYLWHGKRPNVPEVLEKLQLLNNAITA